MALRASRVLVTAAALLAAGCSDDPTREARWSRYECAQAGLARAAAAAIARLGPELGSAETLEAEVAGLRAPGVDPVSFLSDSGRILPYGTLTASQRDTFDGWRTLDRVQALVAREQQDVYLDEQEAAAGACDGAEAAPLPAAGREDDDPKAAALLDAQDDEGWSGRVDVLARDVGALAERGEHAAANDLAELLLDALVRGEHEGDRRDLLRRAGASLLAGRYVDDLHRSAAGWEPALAYDGDGDGELGSSNEHGLRLSARQLIELFVEVGRDDAAWRRLLAGIAAHEARLVRESTQDDPPGAAWAAQVGATVGLLQDATEIAELGTGDEARLRRRQVVAMLDGAVAALPLADRREAAAAIERALDGADRVPLQEDGESDAEDDGEFKELALNGISLLLAAGYAESGRLRPPDGALVDGRLAPFSERTPLQTRAFLLWFSQDGATGAVAGDADRQASVARGWRRVACCGG